MRCWSVGRVKRFPFQRKSRQVFSFPKDCLQFADYNLRIADCNSVIGNSALESEDVVNLIFVLTVVFLVRHQPPLAMMANRT